MLEPLASGQDPKSGSLVLERCLRRLARLAHQSLVFLFSRPWNIERMAEVYEAVCAHSRVLPKN